MNGSFHCTEHKTQYHCRPDSTDGAKGYLIFDETVLYNYKIHGCGYWGGKDDPIHADTEISKISCDLYNSFYGCKKRREKLRKDVFPDGNACYRPKVDTQKKIKTN